MEDCIMVKNKMRTGLKCAVAASLSLLMLAGCSKKESALESKVAEDAKSVEKTVEKSITDASSLKELSSDLKDVGSAVGKLGEDIAESKEAKSLLDATGKLLDSTKETLDTLTSSETYKDMVDSVTSSDEYKSAKKAVDDAVDTLKSVSAEDLEKAKDTAIESLNSSEVKNAFNGALDNISNATDDAAAKTGDVLNSLFGGKGKKKEN